MNKLDLAKIAREKMELTGDLAVRLIGKEMTNNYVGMRNSYFIAKRNSGVDINSEIGVNAGKCNSFLDTPETVNSIKKMLN